MCLQRTCRKTIYVFPIFKATATIGGREIPQPDLLPLTAESLSQSGSFLLDCGWRMFLLVGRLTPQAFLKDVLGVPQFSNIEEPMVSDICGP